MYLLLLFLLIVALLIALVTSTLKGAVYTVPMSLPFTFTFAITFTTPNLLKTTGFEGPRIAVKCYFLQSADGSDNFCNRKILNVIVLSLSVQFIFKDYEAAFIRLQLNWNNGQKKD